MISEYVDLGIPSWLCGKGAADCGRRRALHYANETSLLDQTMNTTVVVANGIDTTVQIQVGSTKVVIEFATHFTLIRELVRLSDQCLLVSPFLYPRFEELFDNLALKQKKIDLISTCAPRGNDQLTKPFSLKSFGTLLQQQTGTWPKIGLDQKLHSKIYIFFLTDIPFAGLVTSANLTHAGLCESHETGVLLTEAEKLVQLKALAEMGLDYVHVREDAVDQLCRVAEIGARNPVPESIGEIGLSNILKQYATPSAGNPNTVIRGNASYFVKPSGYAERPILPEHRTPFDEPYSTLSFAKNPQGKLRLGDCLLDVAVGGKCFLAYYACASHVYEESAEDRASDPDAERWPYFVYANNLSLKYGAQWFDNPIYYKDVVEEFRKLHPNSHVTTAGGDNFVGAMQYGSSWIQVTREFGEFVRTRIDAFIP
jgi:hypothetical protein